MHLELGLLGLEHTVELGGEHDVALDLELAGHESLLAVNLAVGEVDEGVIGEVDGDISLSLGLALVSFSVLVCNRQSEKKSKSKESVDGRSYCTLDPDHLGAWREGDAWSGEDITFVACCCKRTALD